MSNESTSKILAWSRSLATGVLASVILLGSGCAHVGPVADLQPTVQIVAIDSRAAHLAQIQVSALDEGLLRVSGQLRKRIHAHGRIPGKLRIRLYDADGGVIADTPSRYHRRQRTSGKAYFSEVLSVPVSAELQRVEVTHLALR